MENKINFEGQIKSFDETELHFRKDIPNNPKAIVIIVHGLCEHLGRYDYLVEKFNQFGYGVYRFDNRGHGKSGGERGYIDNFIYFIDDADEIVKLAMEEYANLPVFMLGHSMGGFITAGYGVKYKDKLTGQVFSGPCTIQLPIFEDLEKVDFDNEPRIKVPNSLSSIICRDEEVINAYDNDPLVLKETNQKLLGEVFVKGPVWLEENIKKYTYPCLILHGEDDRIVIPEAGKWLYREIASIDKKLKLYEGFFHEILNEKEKDVVIEDIKDWIDKRIL
ncbi:MAG: alpha/beta hydrolase [Firmicutes bacterium HGW-Firmicutes-7]|nr:MAG: alpha/beta hydrolase [Firmicutes bacterium HGW-Firmicutes-7]